MERKWPHRAIFGHLKANELRAALVSLGPTNRHSRFAQQ